MEILAILSVFTAAFIPRVLAARNIDMTWDEGLYAVSGMLSLKNVASFDFSPDAWGFEFHPPVMMYLYGIAYGAYVFIANLFGHGSELNLDSLFQDGISRFGGRRTLFVIRFPSIILGSLSSVLIYLLCVDLFGNQLIGVMAALFLALSPVSIAWSSLAMLESGTAFFYLLTIWTFVTGVGYGSLICMIVSGVFLGLAFGCREFGYFIPLIISPWLLATSIRTFSNGGWSTLLGTAHMLILWVLIGLIVFYISWPWLWRNPVKQLMKSLRDVSKMTSCPGAKWNFYINNLLASTPVVVGLLYGVGVLEAVHQWIAQAGYLVFVSWIVFPLVLMSMPFFTKRGGAYQLSFIVPALSIMAGLGVSRIASFLNVGLLSDVADFESNFVISIFLCTTITSLLLLECFKIHPYYLDYHNSIVDQIDRERKTFLYGWWGEGMSKAMSYVDQNAPSDSSIWIYGPKSTALYHSRRVDLRRSLGDEPLFREREKADVSILVDNRFFVWREGDLRFYFPYYHPNKHSHLDMERLKKEKVSYIVVYRWATYDPKLTALDPGNYRIVSTLRKHHTPAYVVKVKGLDVCWVYKIDSGAGI